MVIIDEKNTKQCKQAKLMCKLNHTVTKGDYSGTTKRKEKVSQ